MCNSKSLLVQTILPTKCEVSIDIAHTKVTKRQGWKANKTVGFHRHNTGHANVFVSDIALPYE